MPVVIIIALLRANGYPEMDAKEYFRTKQFNLPEELFGVFEIEYDIYNAESGNDNCEPFSDWLSYQDKLCFD